VVGSVAFYATSETGPFYLVSKLLFIGVFGDAGLLAFTLMSSSIGMKPDFLKRRDTLFSSCRLGIPLWPHVILTRCP